MSKANALNSSSSDLSWSLVSLSDLISSLQQSSLLGLLGFSQQHDPFSKRFIAAKSPPQ